MPKVKVTKPQSIWIDPDYHEHFSSDEYKCVELWSYGSKNVSKKLYKQFLSDLDLLSDSDELDLKIATRGINEYSYTYISKGKKEFKVITLCSISGSVIVGRTRVSELKHAFIDVNGDLSKLSYENFEHQEDEKGIVTNEFGELEGGYGDFEIADISSEQKITDKDKEFIEGSDYFENRNTMGVAFYKVDELKVYVSINSLVSVGVIK